MLIERIDSNLMIQLVHGGVENLNRHVDEINDLNVFPIPDGDTGSNMLLTIQGGGRVTPKAEEGLGSSSRRIADEMLLSARGNSGVILSQLAAGMADSLAGCTDAGAQTMAAAFQAGVKQAYSAVMEPAEGTILTVAREAADYAASRTHGDVNSFLADFLDQAHRTLANTPEMLPVLKKAGVVDSGGAGLIYIVEGMAAVLNGEEVPEAGAIVPALQPDAHAELDFDRFTEDSELEFGYCTELLLRLQRAKTDIGLFDVNVIRSFLQQVGDSIVCFQTGSIVKIHVHTKEPYRVLQFCQRYGEYLTVKIENMTLQHNSLPFADEPEEASERRAYGVVAVATGEGIRRTFREMGADYIINGGQTMNPSADDFLEAFDRVNADTILVLPNNSNVILAARQAAGMYDKSDVRVIESRSIGDGYAALSMLDTSSGDTDAIVEDLAMAMEGVITAGISRCHRDTVMDGFALKTGQYIGFVGKEIISADNDRRDTACMLADRLDFTDHEICIVIRGIDSEEDEAEEIAAHIRAAHPGCEVFVLNGGQLIHSYLLVLE